MLGPGSDCDHWNVDFSKGSIWWQDLGKISRNQPLDWFRSNIFRSIGDGTTTKFWHHTWLGALPLCCTFPRLYNVSVNKFCSVAEMGEHSSSGWIWNWNWRRNLFVWETNLLSELQSLLSTAYLSPQSADAWLWKLEKSGTYSVKSAYNELQSHCDQGRDNIFKLLWCNKTPFKITTFVWRALMNRIPTTLNLLSKRIIPPSSLDVCRFCSLTSESTDHLFIHCQFAFKVWSKCYSWWGISSAFPKELKEHLSQHSGLFYNKFLAIVWRMVWFATIWYLWKHRNAIIFRDSGPDVEQVFELIKVNTWLWLKFKVGGVLFFYSDWSIDPKSCISHCSSSK